MTSSAGIRRGTILWVTARPPSAASWEADRAWLSELAARGYAVNVISVLPPRNSREEERARLAWKADYQANPEKAPSRLDPRLMPSAWALGLGFEGLESMALPSLGQRPGLRSLMARLKGLWSDLRSRYGATLRAALPPLYAPYADRRVQGQFLRLLANYRHRYPLIILDGLRAASLLEFGGALGIPNFSCRVLFRSAGFESASLKAAAESHPHIGERIRRLVLGLPILLERFETKCLPQMDAVLAVSDSELLRMKKRAPLARVISLSASGGAWGVHTSQLGADTIEALLREWDEQNPTRNPLLREGPTV